MNIEYLKPNDLIPYSKNAKRHPAEQVKLIANSIKEFGFQQPIVIDKDNIVVIGHGRLLAAKRLKIDTVPIVRVDTLTPEQVQAFRLADNKTAEFSKWDDELLNLELGELSDLDFDMEQFGFDLSLDDEDDQGGGEIEEDEAPEEVESRVKLGDVWQLGTHRLICGDCGDVSVLDKLMNGERADLLLTDPPYGIDKDKGIKTTYGANAHNSYDYEGEWDSKTPDKDVFDMLLMLAGNAIIFGANYFIDKLPLSHGSWIVWDKIGDISFQNPFSDCELAWTNFDRNIVKKYTCIQQGFVSEERGEKRVHPTQKPVKMLAEVLNDMSNEGALVLDVFGGSGSTLIACEQTGRRCFMCELSEHYCSVILQRYINLKGSDADVFLLKDGKKIPYSETYS